MLTNSIACRSFNLADERRDLLDCLRERPRLRDLRPDVHLEAADFDVRHFRRGFVNVADTIERDPEFVLAPSRRDILVRVGFNIGIDAQSNRRADILRPPRCD